MLQVQRSPEVHDVVVIGSGAGGGTTVKVLTDLGINVTLLEAGPMLNPATDFKEHMWPWDVDHRGSGPHAESYFGKQQWGYFNAPNGYWDVPGEPYSTAPGEEFLWFRSRIIGGRTNHYGRISLRFSDYDFKPQDFDGLGYNWPVTYDEMSPWYDKAEEFIGVTGTHEGIRSAPDGKFLPPIAPRVHEVLVQRAGKKLNIPVIPSRMAMLTKSINGRAACHYCGQCGRGCRVAAAFTSSQAMIFPAMKTGKLNIVTGAMARELIVNDEGLITAVSYIDKATRTEKQIRARAVVVAASACESARLLLNSKSKTFPNGVANGSGQVGRNLTDTVGYALGGSIPALENMPRHNCDGIGGMHVYVPWWELEKKNKAFPRGYHIEIGGGLNMPQLGSFRGVAAGAGYGAGIKAAARQQYGTNISFAGRGEMIPNPYSWCEIDNAKVDQWGIPVLKFHWISQQYEIKMVQHMHDTFTSFIETMGGRVSNRAFDPAANISKGGFIIHEAGTVRMGDDPKTSALNKWSQAHEVKNLIVADAAPFNGNPDKNVTLTIVANAWRAAEHLAEEMKKEMSEMSESKTNEIPFTDVSRRDLFRIIGTTLLSAELLSAQDVKDAHAGMAMHTVAPRSLNGGPTYVPKYLKPHEFKTLRHLGDLIMPADATSPAASEAGAAEFIDFLCGRNEDLAAIFDGGLAWLDQYMIHQYGADFLTSKPADQIALLDLAYGNRTAAPQVAAGQQFFTWARNMVVDAYYTSPVGVKDIGYMGNKVVPAPFAVPQEAIDYVIKRSPLA